MAVATNTALAQIGVRGPNGTVKQVMMPVKKVQALRQRRAAQASLAATKSMIPTGLAGSVDPNSINLAVNSTLGAQNAPFVQQQKEAQRQLGSNLAANTSLGAQTQASLAQLLANAQQRGQGFITTAGQALADQQQMNGRAASAAASMLGGALNPQTAAIIDTGVAPGHAQQFADATQNLWGNLLQSNAQRDFFQRAGGIEQMQTADFARRQREALQNVMGRLGAQVAANNAGRGDLVRKYAQEDYTLATAFADAAAKDAQQKIDNENAKRALDIKEKGVTAGAAKGASSDAAKVTAAMLKRQTQIFKDIGAKMSRVGTVVGYDEVRVPLLNPDDTPQKDAQGNVKTYTQRTPIYANNTIVFGKGNGPWREAFTQLNQAGFSANRAASISTQWFPQSIIGRPNATIRQLLEARGVSGNVLQSILGMADRPIQGPPEAPVMERPRPMTHSGTRQITTGMIASTLKDTPYTIRAGSRFDFPGGRFATVMNGRKTISGITYQLRLDNGNTVHVTIPSG